MKSRQIAFVTFLAITLIFSCKSVDKSKPEEVIKASIRYALANDANSGYDLISTKSKEIATFDEFKKVEEQGYDSGKTKVILTGIQEQEKDMNYPTFRRFRVSFNIFHKVDTSKSSFYYTLINENNEWKILWSWTLTSLASEKFQKGDYDGAIKLYKKIIELNPFDGSSFDQLAWCYNRMYNANNTTTSQELLDNVATNAKQAITLEPDNANHYNTMSTYYNLINNEDLAIEYLQKALKLTTSKGDSVQFLSNIGVYKIGKKDYKPAQYFLTKALLIDSTDAFALYNLGSVMDHFKNYQLAIECYKRVKEEELEDNLKGRYYYEYASTLVNINDKAKAKEYILKALEISPSDLEYRVLYESLK